MTRFPPGGDGQDRPWLGREDRRNNVALRARFDSARRLLDRVAPNATAPDTALYLVLQGLHRLHPDAPADELEAVLRAVLKARATRPGGAAASDHADAVHSRL